MADERVRFLFLSEGSSESPFTPHLERLCIEAGATEAMGLCPDLGRLPRPPGKHITDRLRVALQWEPDVDLVFIHRDTDRASFEQRLQEIENGVVLVRTDLPWVPVIAVQEIEAWLLLDEPAIREVAGNPRGKNALWLPRLTTAESVPNPKAVLQEALVRASGLSGRRLKQFRNQFPSQRRQLIERLDLDGVINSLPAWQKLVAAAHRVVGTLLDAR
jgi:hypothetical protein